MVLAVSSTMPDARPACAPPARWWRAALVEPERSATRETPEWARTIEHAAANAVPPGPPTALWDADSWTEAFALVLAPLRDLAVERLSEAMTAFPPGLVDRAAVRGHFASTLSRRLVGQATPVLVHELSRRRDAGELAGADGRERFADFVRRQSAPDRLVELMTAYPVLAALLARECARAVDVLIELLTRFVGDHDRLTETLLGDVRPGPVVAVLADRADPHGGGRRTSVVELADGARVVYKPRGVRAHQRLDVFVELLNRFLPGLGLGTPGFLDRGEYGWTAFVSVAPLADRLAAETFHRRFGALLALMHLVRATDLHYDNLIAAGDQPLLVDVETLFHPELSGSVGPDPAGAALARSVARTAMLPAAAGRHGLTDVSAVGGDDGHEMAVDHVCWLDAGTDRMRAGRRPGRLRGAVNRPVLAGRPVDAADHAPAVLAGFRDGYRAISRHRAEFARALRDSAGLETRVVVRPTRQYTALLAGAVRPELLRDASDHLAALRPADAATLPFAGLVEHELADLLAGDVPLFTARPAATDVWTDRGVRVAGALPRPALDDALLGLAAMDEIEQRGQEWVVEAALASRRPVTGHPGRTAESAAVGGTAASADQLLAAACSIGDRLVSATIGRGRTNWLGLESVETSWLVLPMGAGLAHGYTGVALFLAQLSALSGVSRYLDVARRSLAAVPELLSGLGTRPDLVAAVGAGGLHGFGGISYALARMATLLCDDEVAGWSRTAVGLAAQAAELDETPGWADGLAGCAAAMAAVHVEVGCARAGELAEECVTRLGTGQPPAAPGFADGAAGVRYAVAIVTGDRPSGPLSAGDGPGWCRGSAGAALGSADLSPDRMIDTVLGPTALSDLTLCHGELGRTDVLAALGPPTAVAAALRQRAGLVLDILRRRGPRCATPDEVRTPGFLTGLAGIGYGLLRLGHPERVPSALLLAPAST